MASDTTPAETQTFAPSPEFTAQANAGAELYDQAEAEGVDFWARQARELLTWNKDFT